LIFFHILSFFVFAGGVGRCVASPDGCVWTASIDGDVDVWRVKNERHVSHPTFFACAHKFFCECMLHWQAAAVHVPEGSSRL